MTLTGPKNKNLKIPLDFTKIKCILAVYDAYQKLLKAIAEGKPPGGQLEDKPPARKRATPKKKRKDESNG